MIPFALWAPEKPRAIVLMGHGGGRHKHDPELVAHARRLVDDGGFAVVAPDVPGHGERPEVAEYSRLAEQMQARVEAGAERAPLVAEFQAHVARQTVPEWRDLLDVVQERLGELPAGYWGVSLGCGLGVPFVAAEPRVRAAVLGHGGLFAGPEVAARITVPVEFLVQWDDERVPREAMLALFDTIGSPVKTLHANPGRHGEVPQHEQESGLRFFQRYLGESTTGASGKKTA